SLGQLAPFPDPVSATPFPMRTFSPFNRSRLRSFCMKKIRKAHLAVIVGLGIVHVASFAAVKVEEQVLVPKVGNAQIVVSPAGTHVAAVMAKGSRAVVVFDGVESQKFDTL